MQSGEDGRTLFIIAAEWTGQIPTMQSKPTGEVFSARVDVPHAGFPRN